MLFFCGTDPPQRTRDPCGVESAHTKHTYSLTSQTHSKHNVHTSLFTLAHIVCACSGEGKHGQSVCKAVVSRGRLERCLGRSAAFA